MEEFTQEGGMVAKYEIIAGERRFRASKLAGLEKIPAIIREGEQTDQEKLELAILENLQREDLDKARSFNRLVQEFDHTHAQVAEALGKSREYVSNSLRLLQLPDTILDALSEGKISEGHTRPLLMLKERPEEQMTLFMQMTSIQGMTVRDAELDPEMKEIQAKLASHLGTKVSIDKKSQGGKVTIEFGNRDDLRQLFEKIQAEEKIITERVSSPEVVVSTAAIGLGAQSTQEQVIEESIHAPAPDQVVVQSEPVIAPDFSSAHTQDSVRSFNEPSRSTETPDPNTYSQEQNSIDVSDLQKEIYSLAHSATPDSFTTESKKDVPQEPVVQPEPDSKFTFNEEVDKSEDHFTARVDVVSTTPDSFIGTNTPSPVENVQSVSMGSEFVPQDTVKPQEKWTHTDDTGGMSSGRIAEVDIQNFIGGLGSSPVTSL